MNVCTNREPSNGGVIRKRETRLESFEYLEIWCAEHMLRIIDTIDGSAKRNVTTPDPQKTWWFMWASDALAKVRSVVFCRVWALGRNLLWF